MLQGYVGFPLELYPQLPTYKAPFIGVITPFITIVGVHLVGFSIAPSISELIEHHHRRHRPGQHWRRR